MAMLFLIASLLRSAGSELLVAFRLKLGFRVGDALASTPIFAVDGIFERRRLGELFLSFNALLLAVGRRSGWLDEVGRPGAGFVFAAAKMFDWLFSLWTGAVFWDTSAGRPPNALNGFFEDFWSVGDGGTTKSSSSSESDDVRVGGKSSRGPPAAANIFAPELGALIAPFRRGERDNDAIDIGDGSAISISIGVAANIV
jgi:hypothetical protein